MSNLDAIAAVLLHFSSPSLLELEGEILVVILLVRRTTFRVLECDFSQGSSWGGPLPDVGSLETSKGVPLADLRTLAL